MAAFTQAAFPGLTQPVSTAARQFSSLVSSAKRRHAVYPSTPAPALSMSTFERSPSAAPTRRPCSPVSALRAEGALGEAGMSKQGSHMLGSHNSSSSSGTDVSAASAAGARTEHTQEDTEGASEGIWSSLLKLLMDSVSDPKDADSASESGDALDGSFGSSSNSNISANTVPGHGHMGSRSQLCASSRGSSMQYLFGTLLFATGLYLSAQDPAIAAEASMDASLTTAALAAGVPTDLVGSTWALAFVPGMPGAEGPFWDNVLRFVVYFITVFTGGLYTLLQPVIDLAKNPVTLVLLIVVLGGGFSFLYFALSAMLGLNEPVSYNLY